MKVGILVEGDSDRSVVEAIVAKAAPPGVAFHTVRMGGRAAFGSAYSTVIQLLAKGYRQVVCVFNTDTALSDVVAEQRRRIELPLAERGLLDRVSVCPAIPYAELWLLSALGIERDVRVSPWEQVERVLGTAGTAATAPVRLSDRIDLARACAAHPDLAAFVAVISGFAAEAQVLVEAS
jgi:hypothetical protein